MFKSFKFIPKDLLIDNNSSINTDIMNFFSIDCSMDIGSLFVKAKSKTFSKVLQSDKSSNDFLVKAILDFFMENKLKFEDISQIFINQGPGNFSGLRASLAIAKGLSISKNLNLFGYDTFIWSSASFFNKKDFVYSLIKFKEKYFIKKFDKNLNQISKIKEIKEEEIIKKYDSKFKVIPQNLTKNFSKEILKLNNLSIVDLDHKALEFLQIKGLLDENLIKPLYLE